GAVAVMRAGLRYGVVVAGLAMVVACVPEVPRFGAEQLEAVRTNWPQTTEQDLVRGRQLYQAKCGGCHALEAPESRTPKQWDEALDEMAMRARMTDADREDVFRYLWAAGRHPLPGQGEGSGEGR